MADKYLGIPLPTPTKNAVPSTDIRDHLFAGAKLDEEATSGQDVYIDRLGRAHLTNEGRNNKFAAELQAMVDRFNAFIARSGYKVIGDYEDGPLTITEYNQLVRYQNELWKITADTDIPFTTAGNTEESWEASDKAHFVSVGDGALRQNLSSGEDGLGDAMVRHNKNFSVRDMLNRIRTLADNDVPLPYLGYDPENDAVLYNAMGNAPDRHLLLNGGLHIAGDCTNGIRRNAGLFSVRGGQEDSGQGFNVPLMGVATAQELRAYDIYESVPFYLDNTSPERQSYHNVASANYTATTAQIDPIIYATTLAKLEVGDYIRTMHSSYCIGLVKAVDAINGIITVDMWADSKTSTTTPASGVGLYTQYITKIYAGNINLFITENSDITNATGIEMGVSSKKAVTGSIVGYDTVTLPNSTQNITAAYFARSSNLNGFGFTYGFRAQDSQINFHSASTELYGRTPRIGFSENSDAIVGSRFGTKNIYSMLWSSSDDLTDVSLANSTMAIGPNGQNYRRFNRTLIISADVSLSGWHPDIWVTAAGVTITMPPAASHRVGHGYEMVLVSPGTYKITGDVNVNGNTPYTFTTTVARKTIKVKFDGSTWQVFDHL
ncbi:hypothetical protein ABW09_12250 [Pluralibacter gergoviae]|uniref:hypothetical protein n=1 Tax=Pluralibacter gergoviae TaxID=61647 RepID=UPI0006502DBA|nr:hypothetical protein [Pluralibacter gergoviae]KMK17809.1 hypothetical protein ABW09_12250 [Pluralibacter gergoviae]